MCDDSAWLMTFEMFNKKTWILASLAMVTCLANAAPATLVADDGSGVTLCGSLRKERHWGPPNFGEDPKHDSQFDAWFLVPKVPVAARYGAEEEVFKQIQLNPRPDRAITARARGHLFEVVGTLHTAVAPGEVIPVVLWPDSMRRVPGCK